EGIYGHLDELPPKQRQNLGEARDRVFLNREMSRLRTDVEIDFSAADLRQRSWDREQVRVLFDQLEFRTLLPRLFEAVGEEAAETEAETLDADVVVLPDAAAAATRLRDLGAVERSYVLEGRWEGQAGRSPLIGVAVADEDGHADYIDGELLRDAKVSDALSALVREGGPPLDVHRAKELMHALPVDVRSLRYDTAVMAYLLDPAEGKYLLEDPASRYLSLEVRSPDAAEGTLDLDIDGQSRVDETGRRSLAVRRLAGTLAQALEARELTDLYERVERPLVRVLARMEDYGVKIDREYLE